MEKLFEVMSHDLHYIQTLKTSWLYLNAIQITGQRSNEELLNSYSRFGW